MQQTISQKKTGSKKRNKSGLSLKRNQLEVSQISNMLGTIQQTLLQGYSEEGWTLLSRIQRNLSGFIFQKERDELGKLISDSFVGMSKDEILDKMTTLKASILQ